MSPDASPPGKGGRNQRGKERASMGNGAPRLEQEVRPANSGFREVKPNRTWARPTELGHVPSFVNRNTLRVSVIHRRVSRRAPAVGRRWRPSKHSAWCRADLPRRTHTSFLLALAPLATSTPTCITYILPLASCLARGDPSPGPSVLTSVGWGAS